MNGEEFKKIREKMGFSQPKMAEELGVSTRQIGNLEKGITPIKEIYVEKISSMHKKFDAIRNGETFKINSNDSIIINFYPDVYAAAGGGATNGHSNAVPMSFDKGFLEALGLKQFKNLDMIKVTGDSMEPFIQNGEMVILERKNEAQNNDVVVANINGQVYIKRYEADPFFKWIKLKSENEFSGDILLENQEEMDALSIIGIVRAKIRPF